jgi:hypothetical protein
MEGMKSVIDIFKKMMGYSKALTPSFVFLPITPIKNHQKIQKSLKKGIDSNVKPKYFYNV